MRSTKSVPWVPLWKWVTKANQVPEPQQPEPVGAAKLVEPTPEVCDQGDQVLELLAQKEPQTKEN